MNTEHTDLILFEEVQRFRQPVLWAFTIGCSLFVAGILAYGLYRQVIQGHPWGDRPMSDAGLIRAALIGCGLAAALPLFFFHLKLIVRVTRGRLRVKFFPFVNQTIPLDRVARWEARVYHPVREYGGWGIRWGGKRGWAYSVSGNLGVQLEFQDGKRLLIGSRRADDLVRALERAREA